ncbi:MAG: polysaccharide export outer membrane protein [Rhodobacteraceae bacterium HLUCCA08]|nr:MAG: polysaccharide export outer membrane protein [Rhodobacteraceae bacterium HLUCCA08]
MILMAASSVAACAAVPRGAPVLDEVLDVETGDDAAPATFAVERVTGASVDRYNGWPHRHSLIGDGWPQMRGNSSDQAIRAGDTLIVTIWDADDNSLFGSPGTRATVIEGLRVTDAGAVFLPYVDDVRVAGMTADEARAELQEALQDIAPSAQVQLVQLAGRGNAIDILGAVGAAGRYELDGDTSVLGALALGGGAAPDLRNAHVRLLRGDRAYLVALDRLYSGAAVDTLVRGGDRLLVVDSDDQFIALGALGQEQIVPLPANHVSALEALALAGGVQDSRGDIAGILVLRDYRAADPGAGGPPMTRVIFVIDLTSADGLFSAERFLINPGDVLLATESKVTRAESILSLARSAFGLGNAVTN